jgi:formylglycine-generating enzyme required for sulfatase activity
LGKALPILLVLLFLLSFAYATKVCPNCGREYPDEDNYCKYCLPPTKLVSDEVSEDVEVTEQATSNEFLELENLGFELVTISGGTFAMGSNDGEDDEKPIHWVTVNDFKMSSTEVTNAQYCVFLNALGVYPGDEDRKRWALLKEGSDYSHITYKGNKYVVESGWEEHPVVNVSWFGAKAFCDHYGLRLPTEAEWEFAAGGPNHYEYPWGDNWDKYKCCNWENRGTELPPTMEVGSFDANGYGLYDMAGNVWEWCSDWYGRDYYSSCPTINPQGSSSSDSKVLRGGSWIGDSEFMRCANRYYIPPSNLFIHYVGFRCVGD